MKKVILSFALLLSISSYLFAQTNYTVDGAHSSVTFNIPHMGISMISGNFTNFSGTVAGDVKDLSKSKVSFKIAAASINTGNEGRDTHLKGADFFEVDKFADITFESTGVVKVGKAYKLTGNLTIKGVSKPVTFDVTYGGEKKGRMDIMVYGYAAKGKLKLADFGIDSWAGKTGIGDTIDLNIFLELKPEKK